MLKNLVKLIGGSTERDLKKLMPLVDQINVLETGYTDISDQELRDRSSKFRKLLSEGCDISEILTESFAAVREAAKRTLGQRHYDAQLIGGIVLHQGKIAEMRTGEGKTLVATLPAYLNSLQAGGVHVVTVNDYLARRDTQWMGQIYNLLGVSVGVLQHDGAFLYDPNIQDKERGLNGLRNVSRKEAYNADITYGTNNEFGFDYLRDNMVIDLSQRVQRERGYAIVDEVDNILIDEARTPLIISGPAERSPKEYYKFARLVTNFSEGGDYAIDEKHRSVSLTPEGISKTEKMLSIKNLYEPSNYDLVHFIENALKARALYVKDREYVVIDGAVTIVDEFTGRLMEGRRFSEGLHQALEAKEGVTVQRESITYATITLQNYFRLYEKLSGMTGTAATEAEEFMKIYGLEVMEIPTHRPMVREDKSDLIYKNESAKFSAVINDIKERHLRRQPVLVGTTDIDKSEMLSASLKKSGIRHEVLNAKQHEREANIIAEAGRPGAVTVATNMAGRGTDIVLGGNPDSLNMTLDQWEKDHESVVKSGGLHIIGTERHDARRIDNQLRGRSGRQGDAGSSRFYVALDDELMRRFGGERIKSIMDWAGFDEDSSVENKMVSRSIESAQVKVEAYHFEIRKHLVEYDDVVNTHRDVIYKERDKILTGTNHKMNIQSMIERELADIMDAYLNKIAPDNWDTVALIGELQTIFPLSTDLSDPDLIAEMTHDSIEKAILEHASYMYESIEERISSEGMRDAERQVMLRLLDTNWVQHLTAMENLRQGIGLYAYGQRDPLVMYKTEGHSKFQELQHRIQHDIVHTIFHIGMPLGNNVKSHNAKLHSRSHYRNNTKTQSDSIKTTEPVGVGARKVGRNEQCPCGSGRKYKKCHGI